jgi:hypothetical protein
MPLAKRRNPFPVASREYGIQDMSGTSSFQNLNVAVVPYPALGDTVVSLRLAWIFRQAGARVSFYSSLFQPAYEYFPWLNLISDENLNLQNLSSQFDLVLAHSVWLPKSETLRTACLQLDNIACFKSKNQKGGIDFGNRNIFVGNQSYPGANRPLCLDSKAGLSMVQWVDQYAQEAFGLKCPAPVPVHLKHEAQSKKIAIFPTSALSRKDYPLFLWLWLAKRLRKNGWHIEFVGLPKEHAKLQATCSNFGVRSFSNIKTLMDYLSNIAIVISNDSGGGHLASLMGKRTFTITRRKGTFSWRPGFNNLNEVLSPLISIKLFGLYIWRPFIPIWRIFIRLGSA